MPHHVQHRTAASLRSVLQTGAGLVIGVLLALVIAADLAQAARQALGGDVRAGFAQPPVVRVEQATAVPVREEAPQPA
jgi:hypothetical protein